MLHFCFPFSCLFLLLFAFFYSSSFLFVLSLSATVVTVLAGHSRAMSQDNF